MATRISIAPKEFYHVYNRGTERRTIFKDYADYRRFSELLYLCNTEKPINVRDVRKTHQNIFEYERGETMVSIGAYCLMPNHFHLLISPHVEGGLETFMKKFCTGYSMYFNRRYERTGSLFEGSYKVKHADNDEYLKYLFAYIHLNPVKLLQSDWKERGIIDKEAAYEYVSSFQYSSLQDQIGITRPEGKIVETSSFPDYFGDHKDIKCDLFDWLNFEGDTFPPRGLS
jgi:putative transposase